MEPEKSESPISEYITLLKNWLEPIWKQLKPVLGKLFGPAMRILDAALDTKEKKCFGFFVFIVIELMLAWIIAVLDVGIWLTDGSIWNTIKAYLGPDYRYPFGTFLVLTLLIAGGIIYLLWKLLQPDDERNFTLSESNVYGNAREINRDELNKISNLESKTAAVQTVLGEYNRYGTVITMKPQAIANNNICVFGSSGCGKSYSFVKPYIVQCIRRRESVIVTDSKGEIRADTIELARRHGYTVKVLNLKDPEHSDGIDILSELRFNDIRATIFADTFIKNTCDPRDQFIEAKKSLLKAVCLYQERNPWIPPEEKTLYNAYAMLRVPDELDAIFSKVKYEPALKVAVDAYDDFIAGSDRYRGNVVTGLRTNMNLLSSPPIRTLTGTKDIDLTLPGQKPCIYYVVTSDQHQTMKVLSSLFFSFAAQDLVEYADKQPTRRCQVPVNFLMEEFYSCIGYLPNLTNYLSTFRSRALSIVLILQQLGQLKELYGDDGANTITGNCATWLCLGCNDQITAEWLSWRTGEATVKVKTEQHQPVDPLIRLGLRHSTGDGRRNFYNANEIMKLKRGEVLIIWQGYDCLKTTSMGIPHYIEYEKGRMPSISTEVRIELTDTYAREEMQRIEEERICTYLEWIDQGGNPWKDYDYPIPDKTGPATGTDIPVCISYPDLEEAVLAYSQTKQAEAQKAREEKLKELDEEKRIVFRSKYNLDSKTAESDSQDEDVLELPDDLQWVVAESEEVAYGEPAEAPQPDPVLPGHITPESNMAPPKVLGGSQSPNDPAVQFGTPGQHLKTKKNTNRNSGNTRDSFKQHSYYAKNTGAGSLLAEIEKQKKLPH